MPLNLISLWGSTSGRVVHCTGTEIQSRDAKSGRYVQILCYVFAGGANFVVICTNRNFLYLSKHLSLTMLFIYQKYPDICCFRWTLCSSRCNEQCLWAKMPLPSKWLPVSRALELWHSPKQISLVAWKSKFGANFWGTNFASVRFKLHFHLTAKPIFNF